MQNKMNSKEDIINIINQKLENDIYNIKNEPLRGIREDEENVKKSFNEFLNYVRSNLDYIPTNEKDRSFEKIYEISNYFENCINKNFAQYRNNQTETFMNVAKQNSNILQDKLYEEEINNFSNTLSSTLYNFKISIEENCKESNNDIKIGTIQQVEDLISNEMLQEIRGSFKYNDFKNKEEFMDNISVYLKSRLPTVIINKFEEISFNIDESMSKYLENCIEDITEGAKNKLSKDLEKEENKTNVDNGFLSDLKALTNTDEEIVKNDVTEKADEKEKEKETEINVLPDNVIY